MRLKDISCWENRDSTNTRKRGYLTGASNYIFSFLGMAPKDDPELIVYVAVQQPEFKDYADGSIPVSDDF